MPNPIDIRTARRKRDLARLAALIVIRDAATRVLNRIADRYTLEDFEAACATSLRWQIEHPADRVRVEDLLQGLASTAIDPEELR